VLGLASTGINIFNLIPVEPLDGGVALRSVLVRLSKRHMRAGLLAAGAAVILLGFATNMMFLSLIGVVAFLFNMKPRKVDDGLLPLTRAEIFGFVVAYFTIAAIHGAIGFDLLRKLPLLMS
jgi:Zn-dependent protease